MFAVTHELQGNILNRKKVFFQSSSPLLRGMRTLKPLVKWWLCWFKKKILYYWNLLCGFFPRSTIKTNDVCEHPQHCDYPSLFWIAGPHPSSLLYSWQARLLYSFPFCSFLPYFLWLLTLRRQQQDTQTSHHEPQKLLDHVWIPKGQALLGEAVSSLSWRSVEGVEFSGATEWSEICVSCPSGSFPSAPVRTRELEGTSGSLPSRILQGVMISFTRNGRIFKRIRLPLISARCLNPRSWYA